MSICLSSLIVSSLALAVGAPDIRPEPALHQFWNNLTFPQVAWIGVILYVVHYSEERLLLSDWINRYAPIKGIHYTLKKLDGENAIMFGCSLVTTLLLNFVAPDNWFLQAAALGGCVGFLWNTYYHAKPTLQTKVYSPGVVTACLFNPLGSFFVFLKAYETGILSQWPVLVTAAIFPFAMLFLSVYTSHNIIFRDGQPAKIADAGAVNS
jgi:hypothetical protein